MVGAWRTTETHRDGGSRIATQSSKPTLGSSKHTSTPLERVLNGKDSLLSWTSSRANCWLNWLMDLSLSLPVFLGASSMKLILSRDLISHHCKWSLLQAVELPSESTSPTTKTSECYFP